MIKEKFMWEKVNERVSIIEDLAQWYKETENKFLTGENVNRLTELCERAQKLVNVK